VGVSQRSSTAAGFQSFRLLPLPLTEIIFQCPGDGASGAARKALASRARSSPRTEDICCGKWQPFMGNKRLLDVPYPARANKSLFVPTDTDCILAEVPMTTSTGVKKNKPQKLVKKSMRSGGGAYFLPAALTKQAKCRFYRHLHLSSAATELLSEMNYSSCTQGCACPPLPRCRRPALNPAQR